MKMSEPASREDILARARALGDPAFVSLIEQILGPAKIPKTPDRISEVVAFRAWYVRTSYLGPPVLWSPVNSTSWPHRDWLRARCNRGVGHGGVGSTRCQRTGREIPGDGCSCGIYAAVDRLELARQWHYNEREGVVIGEVGLAGKVIPGEFAWQAEKARVLHLWVPHTDWQLAEPLSRAYRVPVDLTNLLAVRRGDENWTTV